MIQLLSSQLVNNEDILNLLLAEERKLKQKDGEFGSDDYGLSLEI